jgi:maltose alpha-D-glucosyltransferase/alpha-amylase
VEMNRFLTQHGYANTPPFLGEVAMFTNDGGGYCMIVAHEFLQNQGDSWQYTLDYLARFSETIGLEKKNLADEADALSGYGSFARAVGTRLGELHALLAKPNPAEDFAPVPAGTGTATAWAERAAAHLRAAFKIISHADRFNGDIADSRKFIQENRERILNLIPRLAAFGDGALQTRIHGDFNLNQILVATGDAYIINFEGDPAKKLELRREKTSPLRDVAGLLRSLHYAGAVAAQGTNAAFKPQSAAPLARFVEEMSTQFLTAYYAVEHQAEPRWLDGEAQQSALLDLFLLEKSADEICYEAAHRPDWLGIPLRGFAEIAARVLTSVKVPQDA